MTNKDREKKQQKLDEIRSSLNKFDVREQKTKNPVVGPSAKKAVKGVVGTPSLSRQKGLEMVSTVTNRCADSSDPRNLATGDSFAGTASAESRTHW